MKGKKGIKVTSFGSMGWVPIRNRHTCCYCLEYEGRLLVLDAGTGFSRFSEPYGQKLIEQYETVTILLSHYHLDHVAGLIYLPLFFREKEVHIAGPGKTIYKRCVKEILDKLISPPFFGQSITTFPMKIGFHDLGVGMHKLNDITLETRLQNHTDPSLGIKIEDSVCYVTDTACSEATVSFARNSSILLHETWFDTRDYQDLKSISTSSQEVAALISSHSHIDGVIEIARQAGVRSLMLIHLNPAYDEERLDAMEDHARRFFSASYLAREGKSIDV